MPTISPQQKTYFLMFSLLTNLVLATILIVNHSQSSPLPTDQMFRLIHPQVTNSAAMKADRGNILHYGTLKEELTQLISQESTQAAQVSVYLQDIHTGATVGINESKGFFPASLLKIPIMMAILKKVDNQELKLDDKITLEREDFDKGLSSLRTEGAGAKVSISKLLIHMIKDSDNTAKNALKRQVTDAELNSPFAHVGIPNPYVSAEKMVNPKNYIRLFKSLYYATYLSPEMSERALELATDTTTEILLPSGVPPHIQVAHKFGVQDDRTLSDCGIIYEPNNPYMLCIMIESQNESRSVQLIGTISQLIYNSITQQQVAPSQ
jgi:beta-lactamase class A